jgi:hypothetical protein
MAARKKKQNTPPSEEQDSASKTAGMSKIEKLSIDQLITQALARHKDEVAADKKQKVKELGHLGSVAEEYLSCFLLIGFSLQNEKVILQNIHNPKDESALMDLLRSTFLDMAGNRP